MPNEIRICRRFLIPKKWRVLMTVCHSQIFAYVNHPDLHHRSYRASEKIWDISERLHRLLPDHNVLFFLRTEKCYLRISLHGVADYLGGTESLKPKLFHSPLPKLRFLLPPSDSFLPVCLVLQLSSRCSLASTIYVVSVRLRVWFAPSLLHFPSR